jgi:hypothetical protein
MPDEAPATEQPEAASMRYSPPPGALLRDATPAAPERLLIVPVRVAEPTAGAGAGAPHYLLVRWADWPQPAMLSLAPPAAHDTLDAAVADLLLARLQLTSTCPARVSEHRIPVRMGAARFGFTGTGWLRAVLAPVTGEPEPDALLAGADVLTLEDALAALSTEVERMLLRDAAHLAADLGDQG